jgi:cytochrome c-type biogenesis protein CcmE
MHGRSSAEGRRRMRLRYGVVALVCIGAVVWMIVLLQRNVVFFKTASEALHDRTSDGTRSMRIGGGVVPASIKDRPDGVDFELYEGGVTVKVQHTGSEPQLFKDCAPVVAEGHWDTSQPETFVSKRLLIKHNNDYEPPKSTVGECPKDPLK